jgi:hypothetical protein
MLSELVQIYNTNIQQDHTENSMEFINTCEREVMLNPTTAIRMQLLISQ